MKEGDVVQDAVYVGEPLPVCVVVKVAEPVIVGLYVLEVVGRLEGVPVWEIVPVLVVVSVPVPLPDPDPDAVLLGEPV